MNSYTEPAVIDTKTKHRARSSCPSHVSLKTNTQYLVSSQPYNPVRTFRFRVQKVFALPSEMAAGLGHRGLGVPRRAYWITGIIMWSSDGQTRRGHYQINRRVETEGSKRLVVEYTIKAPAENWNEGIDLGNNISPGTVRITAIRPQRENAGF